MIRKPHILLLFVLVAVLVLLSGCREQYGAADSDGSSYVSGMEVEALLQVDPRAFRTVISRADAAQESNITSLAVLVFDEKGALQSKQLVDAVDASKPITLRTLSGRSMRVVAVANYTSVDGLGEQLAEITNYPGLTALVVSWNATKGTELLMTGETVTDISANVSLNIPLRFAVAKVTLRVSVSDRFPTDETLTITGVELGSLPTGCGLLAPAAMPTYTARQAFTMQGNTKEGLEGTCYMVENLSGGRTSIAPPVTSEIENATNGHLFKRHYAPANASYAVIHAMHRSGTTNRRVELYVYFGHDNAKDYNVGRSEHHLYTVRIHGLDQIEIDTNVESETLDFSVSLGNDQPMDAHADTRVLYVDATSGSMDIEVVSGSDWLFVSPLDLLQHQVRQPGNGSKVLWQQEGPKGTFVRPKYKPEQGVLAYTEALYALCRGIQYAPAAEGQPYYLHATENYSSTQRTAQVKVTYRSASGATENHLVTLVQRPAVSLGDGLLIERSEEYRQNTYRDAPNQLAANVGMQWGYEANLLYNEADRFENGYFATANAVYGPAEELWHTGSNLFVQRDAAGRATWNPSISYRTKYACHQKGLNVVAEPYTRAVQAPYYTPDYTQWPPVYSPVYGSSAARYCHEKNRDQNGDGVIDPSETEWYLPSLTELAHIWIVWNGIDPEARPDTNEGWNESYWSSSEDDSVSSSFVISFRSGMMDTRTKKTPMRVRCIRRQGGSSTPLRVEGNMLVLDNTALPQGAVTSERKISVPASEASNEQLTRRLAIGKRNASPAEGLKWHVAAGLDAKYVNEVSGDRPATQPTGCAVYSELADGSDRGLWRLPTARELLRLWTLKNKIEQVAPADFEPMGEKWYWCATEYPLYRMVWSVKFEQTARNFINASRGALLAVRCVREIN